MTTGWTEDPADDEATLFGYKLTLAPLALLAVACTDYALSCSAPLFSWLVRGWLGIA